MREYYEEDNPPQGQRWCSRCARWDEDCECLSELMDEGYASYGTGFETLPSILPSEEDKRRKERQ